MPKVRTEDGDLIDAEFEFDPLGDFPSVILDSRGPDRNTEYAAGLLQILRNLRRIEAVLHSITVESAQAAKLEPQERVVDVSGFEFPLDLSEVEDLEELRRQISAGQAQTARKPGAKGGGNPTKRIRIEFESAESDLSEVLEGAPLLPHEDENAAEILDRLTGSMLEWEVTERGWPASGEIRLATRTEQITAYVRTIGGSGRARPTERRFQNPGKGAKHAIELAAQGPTLLLGLWTEDEEDRAVVVAFDAERRAGKETRFSVFVPLSILEEAADTGFAEHKSGSGEVISAFVPEHLPAYVERLLERADAPGDDVHWMGNTLAEKSVVTPGSVGIRPKVGMYAAFARLNYKPWFAIAEFVDNSVQSYLAHRDKLVDTPTLIVDIRIDDDEIVITDRAGGIALADFPRAFSPSQPPPDASGLSEFGLGMKAAACWFSRNWSVRTSAFDESIERTIEFDIPKITREGIEELPVVEGPSAGTDHYTVISMSNLRVRPRGRTIHKIKEHLSSIYRVLMQQGVLRLRVTTVTGTEELEYKPPKLLKAPHFKRPNDEQVLWRKDFQFDLDDTKSVHGWAGILSTGSVSRAGFSIFRRRRLIEGSADNTYRPKDIFRNPNSYTYQRLVGEIHVVGFNVSHTKDGIQWDGLEERVVRELKLALNSDPLPLLKQAEGYRARRKVTTLTPGFGEQAVKAVVEQLGGKQTAKVLADQVAAPEPDEEEAPPPPEAAKQTLLKRTLEIQVPEDHLPWMVTIELVSDAAREWFETGTETSTDDRRLHVLLNLSHPFSEHYINDFEMALPPILRVVAGLALAEHTARLAGVRQAGTIRRKLNQLLRDVLGTAEDE